MNTGESYVCLVCGWVYDPRSGDPDSGIAPGTPWEDVPDDWYCPVCGAGKGDFELVEAPQPETTAAASTANSLVIVGSGLAGYSLARDLRSRDSRMPITLITADGGEAYTKPMLSNALAKRHDPEQLVQRDAVAMAADLAIEIRSRSRVTAIDRQARSLTLEDGTKLGYGRLVLALGADARVFPAEGSADVDIATVNDLDDYRHWRRRIAAGGSVLLIGAGLIGCEFANDLASAGFDVSLVDLAPWPLSRLLPQQIGDMLVRTLQRQGCRFHMGRSIVHYRKAASGFLAELDDGTTLPFDHALSAVGLSPRTRLAETAGLQVKAGILVDACLRTSDPHIFALGDCAETAAGPLPFIAPLLAEARALAATLAGTETPLTLPAMPVVVKTPALPLVVCPPQPGSEGAWELELGEQMAIAIFRAPDQRELGFALAGAKTTLQQEMARRMPALLSGDEEASAEQQAASASAADEAQARYECTICSWVYDETEGDPDGGIAPGTRFEDIPDDWVCPICGASKQDFVRVT